MSAEGEHEPGETDRRSGSASFVSLVDVVTSVQQSQSGHALPRWQIQAQIEAIFASFDDEHRDEDGLSKRIGEGRFLAVGTIGTVSLAIIAGLLIHPGAYLAAAWKVKRLLYWDRQWRPHVIALYTKLDGVEAEVFEAVHQLESELIIINFERYEAEDFESALGREAPTFERIADELPEHSHSLLASTISSLVTRQILKQDGERYWIAL